MSERSRYKRARIAGSGSSTSLNEFLHPAFRFKQVSCCLQGAQSRLETAPSLAWVAAQGAQPLGKALQAP